jgi:hypothetical protein
VQILDLRINSKLEPPYENIDYLSYKCFLETYFAEANKFYTPTQSSSSCKSFFSEGLSEEEYFYIFTNGFEEFLANFQTGNFIVIIDPAELSQIESTSYTFSSPAPVLSKQVLTRILLRLKYLGNERLFIVCTEKLTQSPLEDTFDFFTNKNQDFFPKMDAFKDPFQNLLHKCERSEKSFGIFKELEMDKDTNSHKLDLSNSDEEEKETNESSVEFEASVKKDLFQEPMSNESLRRHAENVELQEKIDIIFKILFSEYDDPVVEQELEKAKQTEARTGGLSLKAKIEHYSQEYCKIRENVRSAVSAMCIQTSIEAKIPSLEIHPSVLEANNMLSRFYHSKEI